MVEEMVCGGIERFHGTDTVRILFMRFRQGHIEQFWRPLWKWLLALSWPAPPEGFSLDLDSTVFQRNGILAIIPHDGHASLNQAFLHYADHHSEAIRLITQTTPCGSLPINRPALAMIWTT